MTFIDVSQKNQVTTWTINRPERLNAIGTSIADQLTELREAFDPSSCRLLCLRANPVVKGDKRISIAGGDLKELKDLDSPDEYAKQMTSFTQWLGELPIPVVSFLEGQAIGGGAEFFIAADIRLAVDDATLQFKQLMVGLPTGYGGTQRLVELVGLAHSQRLLFGCQTLTATSAHQLGLIHEYASSADAEAMLLRWQTHLLSLAPQALEAEKKMLQAAVAPPSSYEHDLFLEAWGNPSHRKFLDGFGKGKSR